MECAASSHFMVSQWSTRSEDRTALEWVDYGLTDWRAPKTAERFRPNGGLGTGHNNLCNWGSGFILRAPFNGPLGIGRPIPKGALKMARSVEAAPQFARVLV